MTLFRDILWSDLGAGGPNFSESGGLLGLEYTPAAKFA